MGKWNDVYQSLMQNGLDIEAQLAGTRWLDRFIPYFSEVDGPMLDLGGDMLRCAKLGYEPYGLDLEMRTVEAVITNYGLRPNSMTFATLYPLKVKLFHWYYRDLLYTT